MLRNLKLKLFLIFLIFNFSTPVYAIDVSIHWTPNNESNLAGYKVFVRDEGQSYNYKKPYWETIDNFCTIYDLDETKTYYFMVRAFDINGMEGANSEEVLLIESVPEKDELKKQEIIFKVQILASSTCLQNTSQQFRGFKNISEYIHNGLYKYTIGYHKDLKSASALQSELRSKGFNGAFVVSFSNGKRIPVREAQRLLNLSIYE